MLPPGRPSSASRSSGRARLDARAALGVAPHAVERSARRARCPARRGWPRSARSRAPSWSAANSRVGRCSAKHVSVCAPARLQLGPEDARVGERVAVDLARHDARAARPAAACARARSSWRVALVDVEGAGEGVGRVDGAVAQPRQPREQQVDLQLRALGRRARRRAAAQAVEHRGGDVGQHVAADGDVLAAARVGEAHRDAVGARIDGGRPRRRSAARAPAARAAASSSAVTAPIPPIGTSQWPLPLPMTW